MDIINRYFPELDALQIKQFEMLLPLYKEWNEKINVISRKDIDNLYTHHVLHSLAIAQVIKFAPGTWVLDVGTGGGFPGIPLAIMFPQCEFVLADSINKKITVVRNIAESIGLKNVTAIHSRAEDVKGSFHFVVSRAVTTLPEFVGWVRNKISSDNFNTRPNGILYLKGGDFQKELFIKGFKNQSFIISDFFHNSYFEEKFVLHLVKI